MSLYIVHVELHGAVESNYHVLYEAMSKLGFTRTIQRSNGEFLLPTAEYTINSNSTTSAVNTAVQSAATSTGKDYWVLVTQASDIGGCLQKVK